MPILKLSPRSSCVHSTARKQMKMPAVQSFTNVQAVNYREIHDNAYVMECMNWSIDILIFHTVNWVLVRPSFVWAFLTNNFKFLHDSCSREIQIECSPSRYYYDNADATF